MLPKPLAGSGDCDALRRFFVKQTRLRTADSRTIFRRTLFMRFPLFRALTGATVVLAIPASIGAQAPAAPPSPLPVRKVVFFTSGVAYTERAGEVEGDAAVPLVFRTGQINDILKSMLLLDERG